MSQLLGIIHGREETFPPALQAEINGRHAGLAAESIEIASVEALERSPYRALLDRIGRNVGYFGSFIHQHELAGVPCWPLPAWQHLDRIGLAQLALRARVHHPPTILLPHQHHPPGVESEDLGNLAYPMPWEQYLQRVGLPAQLKTARLGRGSRPQGFANLSELWHAYARTGHELHVIQPDFEEAQHLLVLVTGSELEVVGYDPISGRYRPTPLGPEWVEAAREATRKLLAQADLFLTGLEFSVYRAKLWLSDLHLYPDFEWWSLGEEAFTRVVRNCADELIRRTSPKSPKPKKTRTV